MLPSCITPTVPLEVFMEADFNGFDDTHYESAVMLKSVDLLPASVPPAPNLLATRRNFQTRLE